MKQIHVNTPSASYDVKIGKGLLHSIADEIHSCTNAGKCIIVSGENTYPLYGGIVKNALINAGFSVHSIVFPAGEETKSLASYEKILYSLTEWKVSRSDCLIALGGGVTGDLTGFAAATYQRGIPYVQVPTSLLAMVDSSVGGKTAVNLPTAKNQVGSFYQPALVLCDLDVLQTLPEREFRAGMAEVIKYAMIGDADLFDSLYHGTWTLEDVIENCIRMKADIVAEDEQDHGRRRLLNFGHTFGHAVENKSGYALLHGEAVSIGMEMITQASVRKEILDPESAKVLHSLLIRFGLPAKCPFSADELYERLLLDKKLVSGKLHLIIPRSVGWCEEIAVTPDELKEWLEACYE